MSAVRAAGWRVLHPLERLAEIFFGLVMAMTFTGAISVAEQGREEIRTLLVGAIGCNLAWGIIDAFMYLLESVSERGEDLAAVRRIRASGDAATARALIAAALPPFVAARLDEPAYQGLHARIVATTGLPPRARLTAADWRGALGTFLLVVLSTFPLVVPFLIVRDTAAAVRWSHAVGVLMLFLVGRAYGRISGLGGWRLGLAMIGIGLGLVALTIALGG